jgi:hypothetical protein
LLELAVLSRYQQWLEAGASMEQAHVAPALESQAVVR